MRRLGLERQAFTNFLAAAVLRPQGLSRTTMNHEDSITVGKYLISPLTKHLANGWYACSVSIRSGSDSATHDRVLRLTRLFQSRVAAVRYATAEGLQWIGHRNPSVQGAALAAH
jgi:hypothetical protein